MAKYATYLAEAKSELKKVQWPKRKEATRHTVMVIAISLGVAAFLGIFDFIFNLALEFIIS